MDIHKNFEQFPFLEDINDLARSHPELCIDETSPEDMVNGLNLNLLSVCDGYRSNTSNIAGNDENRHQQPSKLFPVRILPYLYLGNDETAKNKNTLEQ